MNAKNEAPAISAADFPALRNFLRGYLHEDAADEHGSPEAAARQFWQDADAEQRNAVAAEWTRFHKLMSGQPPTVVNQALSEKLGSRILLTQQDLENLSTVFQRV
jgi:hypothetical protein